MTAPGTPTKMAVAYGNEIDPVNCTSVTPTNITAVSGYSINNLKYPAPGRQFKFDRTAGGDMNLAFALTGTAPYTGTFGCVGILRHNLWSALNYVVGSNYVIVKNGGAEVCTWTINSDADILLLFPGGSGSEIVSTLNITLQMANTPGTMYIGSIFCGDYAELQTNPTDGQLTISRESAQEVVEASGGGRHFIDLGDRDRESLQFETRRAKEEDVQLFAKTLLRPKNKHKIVAVIPPWETQGPGINDMPHFFGYVTNVDVKPRMSASTDHRFDLSVEMIGA